LAALGNFKNGLPNGVFAAFDAAGDTLASAVYTNGNLGYNKYFTAYMQRFGRIQYTVDSIKQAQKSIDKRAVVRNKQQHNFYKKDKRNIWQRDTIIGAIRQVSYSNVQYNPTTGGGKHIIHHYPGNDWAQAYCMVKEQLSPDSNSLIRLKYWNLDNKKSKITTILYYKNTKMVDSIATIWTEDSLIYTQWNAFTHTYTERRDRNFVRAYNIYTMPSDSVYAIYYVSDLAMQHYESSEVHQYYMPPSYRALYKNKFFTTAKLKIEDKNYENDYQDLTENNMSNYTPFYIGFNHPKINAVRTTTETDSLNNMELYFRTDKTKTRIALETVKRLPRTPAERAVRNGLYLEYAFNNNIIQTNYIKGKGEGEMLSLDLIDKTTSVYFYKKDTCFAKKMYDKTGVLLSESVFEPTKNNKISTFTYNKYGVETETIDSSAAGIIVEDLYEADYGIRKQMKGFCYDTLGKIALTYQLKWEKEGYFAVQSWYASGKPQVVFGKTKYARADYHEEMGDKRTEAEKQWDAVLGRLEDFLILHENGGIKTQGNTTIFCKYDEKGQIEAENVNLIPFSNTHIFQYPQISSTASCIWEDLPIQEGKMDNNRRVGTWKAYARTAAKKPVYTLNYNKMGVIDGLVAVYDTSGLPIAEYWYKNGAQDVYKKYEQHKIIEEGSLGDKSTYQKMNTKGQIYESLMYKNEEKITIKYYPNSNIVQTKNTYTITNKESSDSTFDEQGRLLEATGADSWFSTKTTQKGDTYTTKKYYMNMYIYDSQKDYETREINATPPKNTTKNRVLLSNSDITDKKTVLKALKETPALRILTPLSQKNYIDFLPEAYQKDDKKHLFAKTKDFEIADRYGHRLVFTPSPLEDSLYWNIVLQKPTETLYNPIILKGTYSHGEELDIMTEKKKILYQSWAQDLKMRIELNPSSWVYTTFRLPARILHFKNTADAAVLDIAAQGLTFNQGSPHQYVEQDDYYDLPKQKSKAEVYDFYKKTPIDTLSYLHADFKLQNTQAFEIANTGIKITPIALTFVESTPLNGMGFLYDMPNTAYYAPMYYPYHQTKNGKDSLVCDAFLQKKALRLFVKYALLEIDALPNMTVSAQNVLFDDQEINGAFSVFGNAENHQKFAGYCKTKHISIIAQKQAKAYYATEAEYKEKYSVKYHFRILP
jgi:hypothetical protein